MIHPLLRRRCSGKSRALCPGSVLRILDSVRSPVIGLVIPLRRLGAAVSTFEVRFFVSSILLGVTLFLLTFDRASPRRVLTR